MRNRTPTFVAVLVAVVLVAACATVSPAEDPVVIHTQQTLAVGAYVYDSAMSWASANAASFSGPGLETVNKIRVSFPPAYRALDAALDTYKAGKAGDLTAALEGFMELVGQLTALVTSAGGPDIKAAALAKVGGAK